MLAPDGQEARFRGTLTAKNKGEPNRKFAIRVVKARDTGRWRVGFFSLQPRE